MNKTWEELKSIKSGTILHDTFEEGIRFIVMRGPSSLCAYIGVPITHPLSGHDYNDMPINCHCGLTFSMKGDKDNFPDGFYWYGWDYSHCDDYSFYYDDLPSSMHHSRGKKWLVEDVVKDSWEAIYDFQKLMKLSESIKNNFIKENIYDKKGD
jgi:hypothetical protein